MSQLRLTGVAEAAHRLAGYLTGTHSGGHSLRSARRVTARMVVEGFRSLEPTNGSGTEGSMVVRDLWLPLDDVARRLRDSLVRSLRSDDVVDLVLFGSIARASTTGYSDVDAILIVTDEAVMDERRLRGLRSRVLAAERAVLAYQPMQHHGFLLVTPLLLRNASAALGLPAEALETSSSLFGRPTAFVFGRPNTTASERFCSLVDSLLRVRSWPRHAWRLHRAVAMFELAPVLYLQASGRPCAKHRSFDVARGEFRGRWGPYDTLDEVRQRWPRESRPVLHGVATALRNPWSAVALWRRLPSAIPEPIAGLLGDECLRGLQGVIASMAERVQEGDLVVRRRNEDAPVSEGRPLSSERRFGPSLIESKR